MGSTPNYVSVGDIRYTLKYICPSCDCFVSQFSVQLRHHFRLFYFFVYNEVSNKICNAVYIHYIILIVWEYKTDAKVVKVKSVILDIMQI